MGVGEPLGVAEKKEGDESQDVWPVTTFSLSR